MRETTKNHHTTDQRLESITHLHGHSFEVLIERLVGESWQTVLSFKKVACVVLALHLPSSVLDGGCIVSVLWFLFVMIEIFAITIYGGGDCNCFPQLKS